VEITAHLDLAGADGHDSENAETHTGDEHDSEAGTDDHAHGSVDPHIWGDVHNAIRGVEIIRDTMVEVDADNAATYTANAGAYIAELETLDADIRERVATIPEDNRKLVTSHDTFGYYAEAYGFEVIGTALGSISTESGDPSARDTALLVEGIREANVPAIFTESIVNPSLMEAIADEAEVELAPPLYSDALGEEGSDGATYIDMMTTNTGIIVTALGGA
jgi:ABC-type Zn uptake system ZnuABC Zn-binding protein ZnuA